MLVQSPFLLRSDDCLNQRLKDHPFTFNSRYVYYDSGGSGVGGTKDATLGPISFISMQFSAKILPNDRSFPPLLGLEPLPHTKVQYPPGFTANSRSASVL